ncbi:MAG: hypothetical protein H7138_15265 [Myxococcales bacterium]|nr:hypothetical protein [Myxococcales bacterium]
MYVTAQRVRTRDKKEGVNAFLFLHDANTASSTVLDVEIIADQHPGKLILQRLEQDYGMNDVLSYLDVVAPATLDPEELRTIIASTSFDPSRARIWSTGSVSFRLFYSNANYHDVTSEYQALQERILLLLPKRGDIELQSKVISPLRIIAEDNEGLGIVYRLDGASQQRVRQHHLPSRDARVRVAYGDRKALVAFWGEGQYHREIALVVTGLSDHDLAQLGGAALHFTGDQPGSDMTADTEELAGQISGDWYGPNEGTESLSGWPTGAILLRDELALDLVYIERAWYPLSDAGLYTYLHSAGLVAGESWRFVTRSSPSVTYRASFGPKLDRHEVARRYGDAAAARCRDDRRTLQLRLVRE